MSQLPVQADWDVAIIGGGLAGGVAAFHLARHGLRVVLFEKEKTAHHKVCGEFISGEGVPYLEEMGIQLMSLGGQRIEKFRLHGPSATGEGKLPLPATGLSRELLDEQVLAAAERTGAVIHRGVFVRGQVGRSTQGRSNATSLEGAASVTLDTSAGLVRARRLIVATGKYEFNPLSQRKGRDSDLVGFKMHLRLKPSVVKELRNHCDLFVFDGGYGGMSLIENGLANFCFLMDRRKLKNLKADWSHLATYIAKQNHSISHFLDGSEPQFSQFVTIARVPYGFLRSARPDPGVYCVGDQMAVIPSLSGDGMTIALRTGVAAANAIIDPSRAGAMQPASTAGPYQAWARKGLRTQIETAYLLHRLFRNPRLCDWAARAFQAFPSVLDFCFSSTRCALDPARRLN